MWTKGDDRGPGRSRQATWRGVCSAVIWSALASAVPGTASAAIDVYFQTTQYIGSVEGSIVVTNFEGVYGPSGCNASVADCRYGPPTTLQVERGGQIVASAGPTSSGPASRLAVRITPLAGDVIHIAANGSEKAVVHYDGRPTIDNDCLVDFSRTVAGSFTTVPGVTLEASQGGQAGQMSENHGTVTVSSDRYSAAFGLVKPSVEISEAYSVAGTDGSAIGVHSQRYMGASCPTRTVKITITSTRTPPHIRVGPGGLFLIGRRVTCPAELSHCRIQVNTLIRHSSKSRSYEIPGGSSAPARARLYPEALRTLKRAGHLKVRVGVVAASPENPTPGISAKLASSQTTVTLVR